MKPLIVANWKANKTIKESAEWVRVARTNLEESVSAELVICPSHVCLPLVFSLFEGSSIRLGAQDLSIFENGAYTGEDTAEMLEGLVKYCLVGHSERRKNFGEIDQAVSDKARLALKYHITPLVCVESLEQAKKFGDFSKDFIGRVIFVYEPTFAIGTGIPDTPENASEMARNISQIVGGEARILYGGSVDEKNVTVLLSQPNLSGVLVGNASLDPYQFCKLVSSANLHAVIK